MILSFFNIVYFVFCCIIMVQGEVRMNYSNYILSIYGKYKKEIYGDKKNKLSVI